MSASENRNKSQKIAADLVARGFYHGKRASKGLSNVPPLTDVGSAAYRRISASRR